MGYAGEAIERALMTAIQDGLPAALDVVQAAETVDPMTLPDPAQYGTGYRLFMLDLPSTEYPYVLVMVAGRTPDEQLKRGPGLQSVTYEANISAFVVADTEAEVVALAHRYAKALVAVMRSNPVISGYQQVNPEPAVRIIADNGPHLREGVSGDMEKADAIDYMRLVEVDVLLRGYPA